MAVAVIVSIARRFWGFVSDSFFFLFHSIIFFLRVCRSCKGITYGRKKTRIPLELFYFGGPRLLRGVEYFPELVEIVVLPRARRLKNIRESSFANYKSRIRHVSPFLVDTFDNGCYLLETKNTQLSSGFVSYVHSQQGAERKTFVHSVEVSRGNREILSLMPGSLFFQAWAYFLTCQRPPRKLLLFKKLFVVFFLLLTFKKSLFNRY